MVNLEIAIQFWKRSVKNFRFWEAQIKEMEFLKKMHLTGVSINFGNAQELETKSINENYQNNRCHPAVEASQMDTQYVT